MSRKGAKNEIKVERMGGRTTVTETVSVRKVGVLYRSTIRAALVRCLAAKRRKVSEIDI